jgi:hypothetical protein
MLLLQWASITKQDLGIKVLEAGSDSSARDPSSVGHSI